MSRQFTQVGNAVPPLLAYFIAAYIKAYIFELSLDIDADLKNIDHPIIKDVPKHIQYFKIADEDWLINENGQQSLVPLY